MSKGKQPLGRLALAFAALMTVAGAAAPSLADDDRWDRRDGNREWRWDGGGDWRHDNDGWRHDGWRNNWRHDDRRWGHNWGPGWGNNWGPGWGNNWRKHRPSYVYVYPQPYYYQPQPYYYRPRPYHQGYYARPSYNFVIPLHID
jgi:hypothetical protein